MDKSIKAVVLGIAAMLVCYLFVGFIGGLASGGGSVNMIAILIGGEVVGSFVGGLVTARRAPHSPLSHALAFGVVNGLLSISFMMPGYIKEWQFIIPLTLSLVGGWFGSGRTETTEAPEES